MTTYSDEELKLLESFGPERFYKAVPVDWRLPSPTISKVITVEEKIVHLVMEDGRIISLFHNRDCCEDVYIADGLDELQSLVGETLVDIALVFEEFSKEELKSNKADSGTWTFMNIHTNKDVVQLRWYGASNGYYSEDAEFADTTREFRDFVCTRHNDELTAGMFNVKVASFRWHPESQTYQIYTSGGDILAYCVQPTLPKLLAKYDELKEAVYEIFGRPNTKA